MAKILSRTSKARSPAPRSIVVRVLAVLLSRWRVGGLSSTTPPELIGIQDGLSLKGEELGKCLRYIANTFSDKNASQAVCVAEWDDIGQEVIKLCKSTRRVAIDAKTRLEDLHDVFAPFILAGKTSRDKRMAEIEPFSMGLESLEGKVAALLVDWNGLYDKLGEFRTKWSSQVSDRERFEGVQACVKQLMLVNQQDDEMVANLKYTTYPGLMMSLSILFPTEISKRFYKDLLRKSGQLSSKIDDPKERSSGGSLSLGHLPCLDGLINISRMINTDLKSVDSASQGDSGNSFQNSEWQADMHTTLEVYSYFALSLEKFIESSGR